MKLLDALIKKFPTAKRRTLKAMVRDRRVTINGAAAVFLSQPLGPQDIVLIVPARRAAPVLPFPIVFEDDDLLVVNKPAGLLTSTVPREKRPTVLAAVREYIGASGRARVGLIHRLDREASGLLVFSKNAPAHASLKRQFFHHTVKRLYLAAVAPPPARPSGRIESTLVEHADGTVHSTRLAGRGQPAVTDYIVAKCHGDLALLLVTLQTGRKHQIRAHLAERGSPLIGDALYNGRPHASGLMLAAIELHLDHPRTGKRKLFKIAAPAPLATLIESLSISPGD